MYIRLFEDVLLKDNNNILLLSHNQKMPTNRVVLDNSTVVTVVKHRRKVFCFCLSPQRYSATHSSNHQQLSRGKRQSVKIGFVFRHHLIFRVVFLMVQFWDHYFLQYTRLH